MRKPLTPRGFCDIWRSPNLNHAGGGAQLLFDESESAIGATRTTGMDDDQERRGRLLHLGKAEALAHRVARQARC
jgi:hypothetical protein